MSANNERNESVDVLRGVAVLVVVFGHLTPPNFMMQTVIYSINNQLFFLISGFLFADTWKKYRNFWIIFKKKTSGIFVPYISWSVVAALVRWLTRTDLSLLELVKWIWTSIIYANGVWFFAALYTMYIVCMLALLIWKRNKWLIGILIFVVFLLPDNIFAFMNFKKMFVFFLVGFMWAYRGHNLEEIKERKFLYTTIVLIVVAIILRINVSSSVLQYMVFVTLGVAGSILTYIMVVPICSYNKKVKERFIAYGKESLIMYPITQFFSEIVWKMGLCRMGFFSELQTGSLLYRFVFLVIAFLFSFLAMEFTIIINCIGKKIPGYTFWFKGERNT